MQIGVARTPPLEHVFGQSLRHLAHNNRRSRVERRSTINGNGKNWVVCCPTASVGFNWRSRHKEFEHPTSHDKRESMLSCCRSDPA